jgi:hypothetical protein
VRRLLLAALTLTVVAACSDGGDDPRPPRSTTSSTVERTTTTEDDDDDDDERRVTPTSLDLPRDVLAPAFPPVVAGLGDSLLHGANDEIDAGIEEVQYVSEALIGVTIQGSSFGLERIVARRPAGTAVVLGTNNASDGPDDEDVPAVGELMATLGRLPCVRWVEVSTSGPDESFNRTARAINAELHRLAQQYATVEIVPWADAIAAHPEWVIFDGIHHTPAGEAALAEAILDALAACPQTLIRR